jgi:hypothetical protein
LHPVPERDLELRADEALAAALPALAEAPPLCPVDRLPRRRRNQLCISIIALGLLNFLVYTLGYAALGGDAHNGYRAVALAADGTPHTTYYVRGHFIHSLDGRAQVVSRAAWVYSYVHSISVPLTSGALIICMLVLARPHILATMRGGWLSGQMFVTAFGTIVVLISISVTVLFTCDFVKALNTP